MMLNESEESTPHCGSRRPFVQLCCRLENDSPRDAGLQGGGRFSDAPHLERVLESHFMECTNWSSADAVPSVAPALACTPHQRY